MCTEGVCPLFVPCSLVCLVGSRGFGRRDLWPVCLYRGDRAVRICGRFEPRRPGSRAHCFEPQIEARIPDSDATVLFVPFLCLCDSTAVTPENKGGERYGLGKYPRKTRKERLWTREKCAKRYLLRWTWLLTADPGTDPISREPFVASIRRQPPGDPSPDGTISGKLLFTPPIGNMSHDGDSLETDEVPFR